VRRGGDGVLYLAYEVGGASGQGRIALATEDSSGDYFTLAHPSAGQLLSPADVEAGTTRVGDPELYWDDATSVWHLLFTGERDDGSRRVGHAEGAVLADISFVGWVVEPEGLVLAVDMPSVARSYDGRFVLAARETSGEGQAIGIYVGDDFATFSRHGTSLPAQTLRPTGGAAFDADEIAAPSIRVVEGAYQLHFAGRRGTRWGIGVWTSGELVYFRPVTPRSALLAGDGAGFDALGALDPDLLVEGAQVRLFYVGSNGESGRLAVASRTQPDSP
jgi:hypothetical protein